MIKVGIIGGAGYTAGELIRVLLNHKEVELGWVHSSSNAGNKLHAVHEGLLGDTEMTFGADADLGSVDVVFLCSGHGKSSEWLSSVTLPEGLRIIDLAQDFRDEHDGFVYGLPEWQKSKITGAKRIANPGCFATAIQLGLLPLAQAGLLRSEVNTFGVTGSTGAGVKPGATTHFSWRTDNMSVYKAFGHQHLLEIGRTLRSLQKGQDVDINFVPVRGDFARGIFVAQHVDCDLTETEATDLYKAYYREATFTHVTETNIDLKQVVNTNKALVHVEKHGKKLMILSAIDNLLKGASGQAVENMNLAFGLAEDEGLRLKSSAF